MMDSKHREWTFELVVDVNNNVTTTVNHGPQHGSAASRSTILLSRILYSGTGSAGGS